ncbi:MAG: CDP-glycerol glycerophosphotransferase family protein [Flavobacteriales bacterium]|nr:CDP-glycerol glycerophosphotransferase family protein [Flavobacteriales bacterium]
MPIKIKKTKQKQATFLQHIKSNKKIRVAFFTIHSSVWKYDELYNLMVKSEKYEPLLFICPVVNKGKEEMLVQLEKTKLFFESKGYKTINTYNKSDDTYLDIKKEYNPDIIFYTNPYDTLIYHKYNIYHFLDRLTCYVPYSYMVLNHDWAYNLPFHNLCWKLFYPNEIYQSTAKEKMVNKGRNIVVTGYPKSDEFLEYETLDFSIWKNKDFKKIIWSPHHTIEEHTDFQNSNFLELSEFMVNVCLKYQNEIEIAFKPHPLLKIKLYNHSKWGPKKTDDYFNKWKTMPNSIVQEDDYVNLFKTSDALIHDCASFTVEYLHVNKPALYICNQNTEGYFSEIGKRAFDCHYKSNSIEDITHFIEQVVLKEDDIKETERTEFFNQYIYKYKNASQAILDHLNF